MIKIQNVTRKFPGEVIALSNINLELKEKQLTVICGQNGSGKSVLMNLIAHLDEPTEGTIDVPKNSVGLVFQDADAQILGETPEEDIAFGLKNLKLKKEQINLKTEEALKKVNLYEKRNSPARLMSGGEKRRLAVAGILAMDREIIIFDEPFANLDYPGIKQVCTIIKELKEQEKTVIVLTHELEKILGIADNFVILNKGHIVFDGSPEDGLKQNLQEYGIHNPLVNYSNLQNLYWG